MLIFFGWINESKFYGHIAKEECQILKKSAPLAYVNHIEIRRHSRLQSMKCFEYFIL